MKKINVAVAVIINSDEKILIAKRHEHLHQGGKWEFPGGKIEENESTKDALIREIKEEVGLEVKQASPLIILDYDYGDKLVSLDIWIVTDFTGNATGVEEQEIRWENVSKLVNYTFPDANQPIIDLLLKRYDS